MLRSRENRSHSLPAAVSQRGISYSLNDKSEGSAPTCPLTGSRMLALRHRCRKNKPEEFHIIERNLPRERRKPGTTHTNNGGLTHGKNNLFRWRRVARRGFHLTLGHPHAGASAGNKRPSESA